MSSDLDRKQYVMHLETERFLLRNIRASDQAFIIDLWTDDNVTRYMGGPRTKEQMLKDVAENLGDPFAEKYDLWPVIEKETNQPVGHCGLLEKEVEGEPEVEVVYVIDRPHWGKGYATEISKALIEYAFGTRGLRRIIALIKPGNKGSEFVATKIGMHLEKEVVRPNDIRMLLYVIER